MVEESPESPLERTRRHLYEATKRVDTVAPPPLTAEPLGTPAQGWTAAPPVVPKKRLPLAALFLIIALGFFVLAGIAAALILFLGGRSVSSDHIDVSVEGPASVAGGESVPLIFLVENKNPVTATGVTLSADFPDGAYAADTNEPLGHYTKSLADIPPGESLAENLKAEFFGAENQTVRVPVKVEYHTANSNATFVKNAEYAFTVTSAPVSVSVTGRMEAASGQPITITASVRSNSKETLQNIAVRADYPFGFIPSSTDPAAVGTNVFPVGTLAPGDVKEVKVTGILNGEDGDQRVFKFSAGTLDASGKALAVPEYTMQQLSIAIQKSFLSASLSLNNSSDEPLVIGSGESVQAILSWINTLTSGVNDGQLSVTLGGNALDLSSIHASNGFYRSSDNTVVFDSDTEAGLRSIGPGESGNGAFSFSAKSAGSIAALRSPTITLAVSVAGRVSGGGSESLNSTVKRTILIRSDLGLAADAVRTTGPFKNTGAWPPVVDKESTYTIRWSLANSINTVANATVSATLPSYVRFTGQTSGAVTYDETTRVVTWTVGDMAPGTSQASAFQVGLTPSSSQKGTTPVLLPSISATAFDRFVQKDITASAGRVDTEISSDPSFHSGVGRVE